MRLKLASGLVYAALAAFGFAALAAPLVGSLGALVRPYSYAPDLTLPWLWIGLAAALLLLITDVTRRLAAKAKVGMTRYALVVAVAVASLGARHLLAPPPRPTVRDGLSAALARVALAADRAFQRDHAYPTTPAGLERDLPAAVLDLGFRARGAAVLPTRVVIRPDALEPVLAPDRRLAPGEVVFAVDRSRRRYWLTAFTLDGRGQVAVLADETGRTAFAEGIDGKPRSRLDESFPVYPHKVPLGLPGTGLVGP